MGEDINRLVTTSSKKIPTALVAGGAGFVGSGLCEALLNKECRVVCVDNLSAGKKENLKGCFDNPRFVFLDHDVNHQFLSDFPRVDYIFHLAGIEEYLNEKDQNIETLSVNSIGTKNLLDLANKFGAKFLLASSVDVYRGAISTMFLENYFGLSERDTRRYGHHEAKRFAEALVSEYYRKKNLDCRICRLANIYGSRMDLFSETEIASLICAAVKKEPLRIFGEGLKVLHPTFVNDAIEGLIRAMVSEESRGKIYHLINPSSVTVLNLAYLLQKIVPEAKVFFSPEKEELKFPPQKIDMAPTYEELGWNPKTDLLDGLKKTIDDNTDKLVPKEVVASDTKDKLFVIGSQNPTIPELSFWQKALFWVASFSFPRPKINLSFGERAATIIPLTLLLASFLILLPVSFFSWRVKKAVFHLNQARELFKSDRAEMAEKEATAAETDFAFLKENLQRIDFLPSGMSSQKRVFEDFLSFGQTMAGVAVNAGRGYRLIFNDEGGLSSQENITMAKNEMETAQEKLALAAAEIKLLKQIPANGFFALVSGVKNEDLVRLEKTITETGDDVFYLNRFLPFAPKILGFETPQRYLLLFQNNAELRPGGGFIGSYGIATLVKGKIAQLSVDDVYSADGQLLGHLDPPWPLSRYLGVKHWYLRDSNWSPDFSENAKKATWFLEKETGETVNAVIGIDLNFLKEIITVLGSVTLVDYKETITPENFFAKIEKYSQEDFFPGSTAKKDFLSSLSRRLLQEITGKQGKEQAFFFKAALVSFREKHGAGYFFDSALQQTTEETGFSGNILSTKTRPYDYLMFNEANIGGNKANLLVDRQVTEEVYIENGELKKTVEIKFTNRNQENSLFGGDYNLFLRLLTNGGSRIEEIVVDGQKMIVKPAVKTQKPISVANEIEIEAETLFGKTSFGIYLVVPTGTTKTLRINYVAGGKIDIAGFLPKITFLRQKQMGIGGINWNIHFLAPEGTKLRGDGFSLLADGREMEYNNLLKEDTSFSVEIYRP